MLPFPQTVESVFKCQALRRSMTSANLRSHFIFTKMNSIFTRRLDKQEIIAYIEKCHLSDGGYFFAGIEPSGGLDTCLAVKTLQLLGEPIRHARSIVEYWEHREATGYFDIDGYYLMAETYKTLGLLSDFKMSYGEKVIRLLSAQKPLKKGGELVMGDESEDMLSVMLQGKAMESQYRAISLSIDLDIPIHIGADEVVAEQHEDGGFGNNGHGSDLVSSYYAAKILALLSKGSVSGKHVVALKNYLLRKLDESQFLESMFHAVDGLYALGISVPHPEYLEDYVVFSQKKSGGFGRARELSIPTIEHTFYAISILHVISDALLSQSGKTWVNKNDT
jgi:hypothetical protein